MVLLIEKLPFLSGFEAGEEWDRSGAITVWSCTPREARENARY
jgi:hypothetical protein